MGERTFHPAPSYHQCECPAGRWGPDHGPTLATQRWRRWLGADATRRCGPPRRRAPTSRRERRLVGTPSPTDEPAAPISEATPAGPPIAPRINAVAITPLEGPKWSAARAPVQRPAEEIRMRSITTLLTTLLGKTGLLESNCD